MAVFHYDEDAVYSLLDNKERETLYLDYKSAKALEKNQSYDIAFDISKDVSSFANSAGGCIIYGIEEKDHVPIDVDGTLEIERKKEWLNHIINGNIKPRIEGIEIYTIRFQKKPSKAVLVVSIPVSHTVHQAKDKRYYQRYDEESLPMDDYQVRQTMYRGNEPNLKLTVSRDEVFDLPIKPNHKKRNIDFHAINVGKITAKSCWFNIYIPKELETRDQGHWGLQNKPSRIKGMKHFQLNIHDKPIKVSSELIIIHPGQEYPISGTETGDRICLILPDSYAQRDETYTGYYEIWAENMQPKYGVITFRFKDSKSTITVKRTNNIPILNELY